MLFIISVPPEIEWIVMVIVLVSLSENFLVSFILWFYVCSKYNYKQSIKADL